MPPTKVGSGCAGCDDRVVSTLRRRAARAALGTHQRLRNAGTLADAKAIQGDLAAVGIEVAIETYEWNTFLAKVNRGLAGQGDMAEMAWMTNDPDTLSYLALRGGATPEHGGFNSGYYENPQVDALIEMARRTTDRTERAQLYKELQRIVHDDAPRAFVASWRQNAVTARRLQGFALQLSFFLLLRDAYKG